MNKWLLFDVGCIECGEESQPIGLYDTKKEAEKAMYEFWDENSTWGHKGWHGQHYLEIYNLGNIKYKTGEEVENE